jgi:hypothetical protein
MEGGAYGCKGGMYGREGARTDKGRACTAVEGGAHGCTGARTGGEGGAHGREGGCTRVMDRVQIGGDGGTHDGSLQKFQGMTVLLGATLPKYLNEYTHINITCPLHVR